MWHIVAVHLLQGLGSENDPEEEKIKMQRRVEESSELQVLNNLDEGRCSESIIGEFLMLYWGDPCDLEK